MTLTRQSLLKLVWQQHGEGRGCHRRLCLLLPSGLPAAGVSSTATGSEQLGREAAVKKSCLSSFA
jgi:hypothetical protein